MTTSTTVRWEIEKSRQSGLEAAVSAQLVTITDTLQYFTFATSKGKKATSVINNLSTNHVVVTNSY